MDIVVEILALKIYFVKGKNKRGIKKVLMTKEKIDILKELKKIKMKFMPKYANIFYKECA